MGGGGWSLNRYYLKVSNKNISLKAARLCIFCFLNDRVCDMASKKPIYKLHSCVRAMSMQVRKSLNYTCHLMQGFSKMPHKNLRVLTQSVCIGAFAIQTNSSDLPPFQKYGWEHYYPAVNIFCVANNIGYLRTVSLIVKKLSCRVWLLDSWIAEGWLYIHGHAVFLASISEPVVNICLYFQLQEQTQLVRGNQNNNNSIFGQVIL